jgi:hypothetical protein
MDTYVSGHSFAIGPTRDTDETCGNGQFRAGRP